MTDWPGNCCIYRIRLPNRASWRRPTAILRCRAASVQGGEAGHPVRDTISDLGPLLLARMLNLNDTREGVLQRVFKIVDDGLLLLDTRDLRTMLQQSATTPRTTAPSAATSRRPALAPSSAA
jgi:hypothetical protein